MELEARFERVESAHETLLKAVTGLVAVQAKQGENLETVVGIMGDIALAQDKTEQTLLILAAAQANTEQQMALLAADHQDLTADLHLLYKIVDNWIREHGAKNGKSNPDPLPHRLAQSAEQGVRCRSAGGWRRSGVRTSGSHARV